MQVRLHAVPAGYPVIRYRAGLHPCVRLRTFQRVGKLCRNGHGSDAGHVAIRAVRSLRLRAGRPAPIASVRVTVILAAALSGAAMLGMKLVSH
jgi:hypothetical protein